MNNLRSSPVPFCGGFARVKCTTADLAKRNANDRRKHYGDVSRKLKREIMVGPWALEIITRYKILVSTRRQKRCSTGQTMTVHKISNHSLSLLCVYCARLCKFAFTSLRRYKFNTLITRPLPGQSFLHRSLGPTTDWLNALV